MSTPPETVAASACVHCGLCTSACPTYRLTGDENEGPRGRIHLMQLIDAGRLSADGPAGRHLDSCLDCRACETACPSGVPYGNLIESHRASSDARASPLLRFLLRRVFPYRRRLRTALAAGAAAEVVGLPSLLGTVGLLGRRDGVLRQLNRLRPTRRRAVAVTKSGGPTIKRSRVHLLRGCVADAAAPDTHAATVALLDASGVEVVEASGQGCCGAVAYHAGLFDDALDAVRRNAAALAGEDPIVVNVAGCGAFLKEAAAALSRIPGIDANDVRAAASLASRTVDVCELLAKHDLPPLHRLHLRVAYQSACHLHHAQRCGDVPQRLLRRVPGLTLVEPEDAGLCCGAAGTYNLTHIQTARELGRRKADALLATGPDVIATANIGCRLQLEAELRDRGVTIPVVHPVQILAEAAGVADSGLAAAAAVESVMGDSS